MVLMQPAYHVRAAELTSSAMPTALFPAVIRYVRPRAHQLTMPSPTPWPIASPRVPVGLIPPRVHPRPIADRRLQPWKLSRHHRSRHATPPLASSSHFTTRHADTRALHPGLPKPPPAGPRSSNTPPGWLKSRPTAATANTRDHCFS